MLVLVQRANVGDVHLCRVETEPIDKGIVMRLLKSFELALSVVAGSGMVLLLSGSAYAAESGLSTTSQVGFQAPAPVKTDIPPATMSNTPGNVLVVTTDPAGQGTVAAGNSVTTSSAKQSSGAVVLSGNTQDITRQPAVPTDQTQVPAKEHPSVAPAVSGSGVVSTQPAMGDVSTSVGPSEQISTVIGQSGAKLSANDQGSLMIGSAIFPIKPRITNAEAIFAQDLASMVPTAPDQSQLPAKQPTPAQPNSALNQLTAELAGSVVPPVYFSPSLLGTALVIGIMMMLLACVPGLRSIGVSFGTWLRQGGYAHAARSDVAATPISFFATPPTLSYETANLPTRSSFLMVSKIKTGFFDVPNAFRKEEMK